MESRGVARNIPRKMLWVFSLSGQIEITVKPIPPKNDKVEFKKKKLEPTKGRM